MWRGQETSPQQVSTGCRRDGHNWARQESYSCVNGGKQQARLPSREAARFSRDCKAVLVDQHCAGRGGLVKNESSGRVKEFWNLP
jgi:hypothetical protein